MPHSLRVRLKKLQSKGELTEKDIDRIFKALEQEPKTGHCEDCKHFRKLPYHADILGKCVNHWGFCPKGDWYCADFEPQESEDKERSE